MKTINRSIIKGRVGKEPILTRMPSGDFAVRFDLATDHVFNRREGKQVHTEWHPVKTHIRESDEAHFRAHLYPGAWVLVEGPSITDVVTNGEKTAYYKSLRPFPEDIDFLSPPKTAAHEEAPPLDEQSFAPVASRYQPDPSDEPPPIPAPAPTPAPKAFAPRDRNQLWPEAPSSPKPRKHGSVKDLLSD